MRSVIRLLPYTRHLVFVALFDILDQEKSHYSKDENDSSVLAEVSVFGNKSEFKINVNDSIPGTEISIEVTKPLEGLSEKGQMRAANYIADRVEQMLENEIMLNSYMGIV